MSAKGKIKSEAKHMTYICKYHTSIPFLIFFVVISKIVFRFMWLFSCSMILYFCSYIQQIGECAKRSPELIQLLELHSQFAAITPYTQVV